MPVTQPPEIIEVDADAETVMCDGGGVLGHPRVYYSFGTGDTVECGYCDRRFVRRRSTTAAERPAHPDAAAAD